MLGSAEYGAFTYIATTAILVSSLGVLGFCPLVTRAIASGNPTRHVDQLTAAVLCIVSVVLILLGAALYTVVSATGLSDSSRKYELLQSVGVAAIVVWALGAGISAIVGAVFAGHRRFVPATLLTVARAVAVGGAALATSALTGRATDSALAAGIAELLLAAAGVGLLCRERHAALFSLASIRAPLIILARGAIPAGVASLSIHAAIWFTQSLILLRPDGLSENGAFGLASRLSLLVSFLPTALAITSVSFIGQQSKPVHARRLARRIIQVGFGAALLTTLAIAIAAGPLNGIFGTDYTEHASTTVLMALGGLAVSANALFGNAAVGVGRVREWVLSDIVLASAMAIAAVILVPPYGPNGAAIAYLLSYGISAGFLALRLRTETKVLT